MNTALATRPTGPRYAPFGLAADLAAIDQVLIKLEHGGGIDRDLDADAYEALGWTVDRGPRLRRDDGARPIMRRRLGWRCRSPLSSAWEVLPSPTGCEAASARLVPFRWSYSAGVVDGIPRAWCRENVPRPGREPRFSEVQRLTVPRALTAAALHAHRQLVLEAMGHA